MSFWPVAGLKNNRDAITRTYEMHEFLIAKLLAAQSLKLTLQAKKSLEQQKISYL